MATQIGNLIFRVQADLQQIQGDLRRMEGGFKSSFSRIEGGARNFARTLGVGLGLGAATAAFVGFTKATIGAAKELDNISTQTGIGIRTLGGLKLILDQNALSMSSFARSINRAQKEIGEGSAETVATLKQIGLTIDEVRQATGDDFLDTLAKGLAGIEDHNRRLVIGNKLLGRSYGELAPVLDQVARGFQRQSGEFEAGVKALASLGFQGQGIRQRLEDAFTSWVGRVALGLGLLPKELQDIEKRIQDIREALSRPLPQDIFGAAQRNVRALRDELEALLQLQAAGIGGAAGILGQLQPPGKSSIIDPANAKRAEGLLEGLRKQAVALQSSIAEAMLGPGGGLTVQLNAMRDQLRELKVSPTVMKNFETLAGQVLTLNEKLGVTKLLLEQETALDIDDREMGEAMRNLANATSEWTQRVIAAREELQRLNEIRLFQIADQDAEELANAAEGVAKEVRRIHDASLDAQLDKIFEGWSAAMLKNRNLATALSSGFNKLGADIFETENALRKMVEAGDTSSETFNRMRERLNQLANLKAVQDSITDVMNALRVGVDDTLTAITQRGEKFSTAMGNLFRNMALRLSQMLNEKFIFKPIEDALKGLVTDEGGLGRGARAAVAPVIEIPEPIIQIPQREPVVVEVPEPIFKLPETPLLELDITEQISQFSIETETEFIKGFESVTATTLLSADQFFADFRGKMIEGFDSLKSGDFAAGIQSQADAANASLGSLTGTIETGIEDLTSTSETGFSGLFSSLSSFISKGLQSLFGKGGGSFLSILGGLFFEKGGPVLPEVKPLKLFPHFASGGEVPAILHEGEFVIRRDSVEKLGLERLKFMNQFGELPQFKLGGFVMPSVPSFQAGGPVAALSGNSGQSSLGVTINVERIDARGAGAGVKNEIYRAIDQAMQIARRGAVQDVAEGRLRGGTFGNLWNK